VITRSEPAGRGGQRDALRVLLQRGPDDGLHAAVVSRLNREVCSSPDLSSGRAGELVTILRDLRRAAGDFADPPAPAPAP
jgi:hypothetical protein